MRALRFFSRYYLHHIMEGVHMVFQEYCDEALIWQQLRHVNILPFLGCCADEFSPRYALVSPWMENGNMLAYMKKHPGINRLSLVNAISALLKVMTEYHFLDQLSGIASGLRYLHTLKPQI